ncbi:MAG: TIGR02281 family clan AA aspartic protease, partial [Mesorhizobium sp.]
MLRNLLILGVLAVASASFPMLYQSNPQMFEGLLKSAVGTRPAIETDLNLAAVPDRPAQPLGRKVV